MPGRLFDRYGIICAVLAAVLFPFKLSLGYLGLIPLISLWIFDNRSALRTKICESSPEVKPFIVFLVVAAVTSLFGINPWRSFQHIGTLIFFPLTILAIRDLSKEHSQSIITALVAGMTMASFNSLLEGAFPSYDSRFLGAVSQSGQMTLIFFVALGLYFASQAKESEILHGLNYKHIGFGTIFSLLSTLLGFSSNLKLSTHFVLVILLALLLMVIFALYEIRDAVRDIHPLHSSLIITIFLPIINAALLVNLKRGPWVGIFIGFVVLCFIHARKLIIPLVLGAALLVCTLNPIQHRLLSSEAHFFISGGRNSIWQIGQELAVRYPLGIGFENSGFLRDFSRDIPNNLKHFHNNFINILVETGWIGLFLYSIAIFTFIRAAFRTGIVGPKKILMSSLGCALIAWQCAGVVEYNFGDSSVVSIAYIVIGLIIGISERETEKLARSSEAA